MAKPPKKKICRLKGIVIGCLEIWRFLLLGWSDGNKYFFCYGSFSIKNGLQIQFIEDKWNENTTLRELYHALYSIVRHKGDTISTVMATSPPNITFRRDLVGPRLIAWNALLQHLSLVQINTRGR
jgi:hypothetical protein